MIGFINLLSMNIFFYINHSISFSVIETFYHYHDFLIPSGGNNRIEDEIIITVGRIPIEYDNPHYTGSNYGIPHR
jgi:hypothetical protein